MSTSGSQKKVFVKKSKAVRLVPKGSQTGRTDTVNVPSPPIPEPESLFEFFCPYCGHKIPTRRSKSGLQITCSVCDQSVAVPNPSSTEISVSTPAEEPKVEQSFKFYCVYCGQRLSAVESDCGKSTTCPSCDTQLNIPDEPPDEERFASDAAAPVAFIYFCPHCGRRHSAIESWVGESIQCSGCEVAVVVPAPLDGD